MSGIIVRNSFGTVLRAWTGCFDASFPFEAEAIAAYQAFQQAESLQLPHAVFEGDALNVILALNGSRNHLEWRGRRAISDGRSLLRQHPLWSVMYSNRNCNRIAHKLAHWAKSNSCFGSVNVDVIPSDVLTEAEPGVNPGPDLADSINDD